MIVPQLPGSTDTAASYAFEKEDHTLGNALRYMIMKKCVRALRACQRTVKDTDSGN